MIELKSLSVGYGKTEILKNANASFEKGKLTVLVGVNGCGKTTLLKTVAGILPPLNGSISADGSELSCLSQKDRARILSYLPQGRPLPDMTVGELVLHGRFPHLSFPRVYSDSDKSIAKEKMKQIGIEDLCDFHLSTLSGGMRQKAYIAMALASESEYLLLDEPTTYLDIAHQIELMKILKALAESGKGVVAVLHDLSLAMEYADELAVISNGSVRIQASSSLRLCSDMIGTVFGVDVIQTEADGRRFWRFIKK